MRWLPLLLLGACGGGLSVDLGEGTATGATATGGTATGATGGTATGATGTGTGAATGTGSTACPDGDADGDGVCNGDDPCPLDAADDSDGDGSCDSDDLCPGFDDAVDGDGDGNPDDCDPCPVDDPDDTDGDGLCESDDPCPTDPDPTCAPSGHLSQPFYPQGYQGQYCNGDAPANWYYWGQTTFDDCENTLNATGTQWFVGIWTTYTEGWIGGQDAVNANATSASDWTNEVLVPRTSLYSCVSAQIEHRTAPTAYPIEQIWFDPSTGRTWHYWDLLGQTASQAISFADDRGARIINPSSVGQPGLARMTAPTHWCHASAEFNGGGNCNSDNICNFMVGYFE